MKNSQILNKIPEYMYLVTGVAGFIGFHLSLELLKKKIAVIGVDNINHYYDQKINDEQTSKYLAIKCASLLRETMWSMVSEITSKIDFDYKDYTHQNLSKFNEEFKKLES